MFLSRQIGSKIRTDFLVMAVICGNLTIAVCGLTAGIRTALAMNEASRAALPFDLNVLAEPEICGETDIAEYLKSRDVDMERYAKDYVQISLYSADFNYAEVFAGQDVTLCRIDEAVPESEVAVITVSDFNKFMTIQGKEGIKLDEDKFLLNCNYEGTFPYIEYFLQNHAEATIGGITLYPASMEVTRETYFMTSMGNNDRGTFIVPDSVAGNLEKDANILLVQYGADTDADEVFKTADGNSRQYLPIRPAPETGDRQRAFVSCTVLAGGYFLSGTDDSRSRLFCLWDREDCGDRRGIYKPAYLIKQLVHGWTAFTDIWRVLSGNVSIL